jgi:hypothetical protein
LAVFGNDDASVGLACLGHVSHASTSEDKAIDVERWRSFFVTRLGAHALILGGRGGRDKNINAADLYGRLLFCQFRPQVRPTLAKSK